jgi:hypothetical protein
MGADFRPKPGGSGGADPRLEWDARLKGNTAPTVSGFQYDPRFVPPDMWQPGVTPPPPPQMVEPTIEQRLAEKGADIQEDPEEKSRRAKIKWLRAHGFIK